MELYNNKYFFCFILLIVLIGICCNYQSSNQSYQAQILSSKDEAKRISKDTTDIRLFFNVRIKARCGNDTCKKSLMRFEMIHNEKYYNIPVWKNLIDTNMVYDTYKFGIDNTMDSFLAIKYFKTYSNRIINLYNRLDIYDIRGGHPDLGDIIVCKTNLNSDAVFAPDTNRINHEYWKRFVRNASYNNNNWYFSFAK